MTESKNNRMVVRVEIELPQTGTAQPFQDLLVITPSYTQPQANQQTPVRMPGGFICAGGRAIRGNPPTTPNEIALSVYAKVYPTAPVVPPAMPPADAVVVQPDALTGVWAMDQNNGLELAGAAANGGPNFPQNTFVVWYVWPSTPGCYQMDCFTFLGQTANRTACEGGPGPVPNG